jgi:hypothetical protein
MRPVQPDLLARTGDAPSGSVCSNESGTAEIKSSSLDVLFGGGDFLFASKQALPAAQTLKR